jgi:Mn-containing catalase
MGQPWRGDYVFNSGNLILDLLHNFFLENGARTHKLRVYELTDNPAARQMLGYLFVRGGVHAHAYALALEELTGVEMKKMLPIPKIENVALPESKPYEDRGFHRKLYRFSPDDYKDVAAVWHGQALDGSGPLEVVDGPPEGGDLAKLDGAADAFTPEYHGRDLRDGAEAVSEGQVAAGSCPIARGPEPSPGRFAFARALCADTAAADDMSMPLIYRPRRVDELNVAGELIPI